MAPMSNQAKFQEWFLEDWGKRYQENLNKALAHYHLVAFLNYQRGYEDGKNAMAKKKNGEKK